MRASRRPRLLFVCAEMYPLVKTDGLADVCAALPRALARASRKARSGRGARSETGSASYRRWPSGRPRGSQVHDEAASREKTARTRPNVRSGRSRRAGMPFGWSEAVTAKTWIPS